MLRHDELPGTARIPYALRSVPEDLLDSLIPSTDQVQVGDIVLARLEKMGKNTFLELANGRRCKLHEGDLLAVVFGNRHATLQFEGYARADGDHCDLLSMGGLCGLVTSKHAAVSEPTRLRVLGAIADGNRRPLRLAEFALASRSSASDARTVVVCGTSMDVGKTHTAVNLIMSLRQHGYRVAGIKLTGTASGRDLWSMRDAGADPVLDFVDGGFPSTFLCPLTALLDLCNVLTSHAAAKGAEWIVMEIADGLLQSETAALLRSPRFVGTADAWILAAREPLAAIAGMTQLRSWDISPLAISGIVSMSALGIRETEAATSVPCLTAAQVQSGPLLTWLSNPRRATGFEEETFQSGTVTMS